MAPVTILSTTGLTKTFGGVVANNDIDEGSYGTASNGLERPADVTSLTCPTPQNLQYTCD